MQQLDGFLATLRRPRLLVRAARHGISDYNRKRDLTRLTGQNPTKSTRAIIEGLIVQEGQLEETRRAGDAAYRPSKHIELLVALIAECRLLPRSIRA
ncbi:MAG: DUF6477 family protein [Litoreibacter sp.]|nr:DUF6477 family protein [Litoreibacter sp.]MCY4334421.1 DUF6477 family protein [Litoreibacter sp.]